MKSKIVKAIEYAELEPEIRAGLDRYLARLIKATGWQWKISLIYKPGTWHRARLTSRRGGELRVWHRSKKGYWTKADWQVGHGIVRPRQRHQRHIPETEKQKLIDEALKLFRLSVQTQKQKPSNDDGNRGPK